MPKPASDLMVLLTLAGLTAFVALMWLLGAVHDFTTAIGFFVGGYAVLYMAQQIGELIWSFVRPPRRP